MNIENLDITLDKLRPYFLINECIHTINEGDMSVTNIQNDDYIFTTNIHKQYLNKTLKGKFKFFKERIKKVIEDILFINDENNPLTSFLYKKILSRYKKINKPKQLIATCIFNNVSALQFLKEVETFQQNKILKIKVKLSEYCKNTIDIIAEHFNFSLVKSYAIKLLIIQHFFLNVNKKLNIQIKNKRQVYSNQYQKYALVIPNSLEKNLLLSTFKIVNLKECCVIILESYKHCLEIKRKVNNKYIWGIQLSKLQKLLGYDFL